MMQSSPSSSSVGPSAASIADECMPDFSSYPPIFVLSTHISLKELRHVEDRLLACSAHLTYDAAEAYIFVGKLNQKKRAALELRSLRIWTEEVQSQQPKQTAESESDLRSSDAADPLKPENIGVVKVVRLDWLDNSVEAGKPLPLRPFLVYQARKISPQSYIGKLSTPGTDQIRHCAGEDAASQPASFARIPPRHSKGPGQSSSQQRPSLYHRTVSEHDESILRPTPDWVKANITYACMRSAPLHPPNELFMDQLTKIRKIRQLTLNEIGVRAYSSSIAAIAAYPYKLTSPSEVLTLPGCDAKIASLFAEFKDSESGTVAAAAALDIDPVLRVLAEFNNIWGVGAKTARDFYYKHRWRDLDDIVEYGWNTLSRAQQIGVKFFDEFLEGIPRSETERIAAVVAQHAHLVRPNAKSDGHGVECIIVGGYRRGKEYSNDVDVILTHRDESVTKNLVIDIVTSLEAEGWITHTLTLHSTSSARDQQTLPFRGGHDSGRHFDTLDKALVVWQDTSFDANSGDDMTQSLWKTSSPHRRVDIIISPWRTVGCAVLGWSGDTTFERDLRRLARKQYGWKFDSSGIRERTSGGRIIDLEHDGQTWEERERMVLEGIGAGWREPWERCTR